MPGKVLVCVTGSSVIANVETHHTSGHCLSARAQTIVGLFSRARILVVGRPAAITRSESMKSIYRVKIKMLNVKRRGERDACRVAGTAENSTPRKMSIRVAEISDKIFRTTDDIIACRETTFSSA